MPQTFNDVNTNTTADGDAVSGYVFCLLILTSNFLTTWVDRCGHLQMAKYNAGLHTDYRGHISLVYRKRILEHVIVMDDGVA